MAGRVVIMVEVDTDELVASQGVIQGALAKTGTKGNVVFTELRKQQQQAAQAANLFARVTGTQMPRALESVLAKSKLVGPALAAAFNVAVFAAFGVAILSQLPRIAAFIDELRGITEELKKAREEAANFSRELFLIRGGDARRALAQAEQSVRELEKALEDARRLGMFPAGAAVLVLTGRAKELKERLALARDEVKFWAEEVDSKFKRRAEEAAEATRKWNEHLRQLRAEIASGDALLQRLPGWENFRKEAEKLRAARVDEAIARINEELINGPLADPNFDPGKVLAGIRQALGELPTALPPQGTKESADAIRQIEEQLAIDRARLEGRTIDAIIIEEARRVEETLKHLESIGASEAEMQRARETLAKQTEIKIAEENRRRVEEMAGTWDSFVDRVIFGAESWKDFFKGMLREMLATFLKFIGRMIIAWITGLEKMRDIWEAFKKSLPGGGGGVPVGVIIKNLLPPPSFAHGGLVDDVLRRSQAIHSVDGRLLAILDEHEAVLNAGATRLLGASRIQALNRQGQTAPSFQSGGFVGAPPAAAGPVTIIFQPGSIVSPASNPALVAAQVVRRINHKLGDAGRRKI